MTGTAQSIASLACEAGNALDECRTPVGVGPESAACWEVDLSHVRALIDAVAGGAEWTDWVASLLHGARIVDVNERGLQLVGSPVGREMMIGQPVACFCPGESWSTLADLIVAVASDRPDHALRRSRINSFLLRDAVLSVWGAAENRVSDTVWVAVDGEMTDDRSFWAVRASEQRYRRLIHHLPGALLQVDARALGAIFYQLRSDGVTDLATHLARPNELVETARRIVRVTDANRDAVSLLGAIEADALIGPIDYLFAAAPEAARRAITAHFEGRRSHSELMKLRTFDGRLLDVQLSVTYPTPPERLDVTLISLEDVTQRLETEAQLRQLQAEYARAARVSMLGELASSIAHEVNQPLAAIAMNAETSLRWLAREEPNLAKVSQLAARIAESARHASAIVRRIMGTAARHVPERLRLDVGAIVQEALQFVRHDIDSRGITLSVSADSVLPPILGDRVQLQQVVVNLLVNSIQAIGQSGSSTGRIDICITASPAGPVTVSVPDNGPGIPAENLDRVFDSLFTTKQDGVGIGLAICRSIVTDHGGTISVSSDPKGGAMVSFSLNAQPEAPENPMLR